VTWETQLAPDPQGGPRACSIAGALEILGDRWSLLVVRECSYGVHRFNDIQRSTGAATDILTSRLKRLEAAGILRREPYSSRPVRHEYFLTRAGEELFPILLALREWGQRQLHPDTAPVNPVWHNCGAELHVETVCEACREVVTPADLRYH
jgi:DNA-binding HxlR family transcriptional regulator